MVAKPISIKDAKRKSGGCAWKAIELISGELRFRGPQAVELAGGIAPANQLRLSFTGSEDGEASVANDDSNLRPARAQLAEPPYADPTVVWEGGSR
jgi:hypothetical protein